MADSWRDAPLAPQVDASPAWRSAPLANQAPPAPQRQGSYIENLIDSITSGAVFGFGDELTALEAAVLGRKPGGGTFDIGNYDVPFGERYDRALAAEREQNQRFSASNPVSSTVGEVGGAVASGIALPGLAMQKGATLLSNALRGGATGAAQGALYGFGSGEGGTMPRAENAIPNAIVGGAAGVALAPVVQAGSRAIDDMLNRSGRNEAGVSNEAYRIVRDTIADDARSGGGAARVAAAGESAMLADSGPGAASLLDVTGQYPAGRQVVYPAVQQRARESGETITRALDDTLGPPEGPRATARKISESTATRRADAYDEAYAKPIDYASDAGRAVEEAIGRIPPSILNRAIQEANDDMLSRGLRNLQVLANVADDGTVTFREMPNVQQVDEIKKALQRIGYGSVDQFGRPTAEGARARRLAGELRDAIGKAVPEYNAATAAGADKIAMDEALKLGRELLRTGTEREVVQDAVKGMTDAERKMVGTGVRSYIEDITANVQRALTDPNMDAREAVRAVRELSSRANRDKLREVLGNAEARRLFDEIDRATMGLDLRAATATNSRTAPRMLFDQTLQASQDTVTGRLLAGNVPSATARAVQTVTGRTPADLIRNKEKVAEEIALLLTQRRGQGALELAQELQRLGMTTPQLEKAMFDALAMVSKGSGAGGAATGENVGLYEKK